MMKGADAAILAVCYELNMRIEARPVYVPSGRYAKCDLEGEYPHEHRSRRQKFDALSLFGQKSLSKIPEGIVRFNWIGNEFRTVKNRDQMGFCDDLLEERLAEEPWIDEYTGVKWLNTYKFKEPNQFFVTVYTLPSQVIVTLIMF
jgi:hypothetical protein